MERIKSLKIGGHDVRVVWVDDTTEMRPHRLGENWTSQNTIRISTAYPKSKQEACLLHEIVHNIMWNLGHGNADDEEPHTEKTVQGLAEGLYQVLRDNKLKFF